MVRRSRLSRSALTRKVDRLEKMKSVPDMSDEFSQEHSIDESRRQSMSEKLGDIKTEVAQTAELAKKESGGLGRFIHEVLYLETPEDMRVRENMKIAKRLSLQYPDEELLVKVVLNDEPADEVSPKGFIKNSDFMSFDELEFTSVDGAVVTVPRTMISEFIGIQSHSVPIGMSSGQSFGMVDRSTLPVVYDVLQQPPHDSTG